MIELLRDFLLVQCREFLQKLNPAMRTDVYALSLFTDVGDTTEPELVLGFNTHSQVKLALEGKSQGFGPPSDENEARWNYAFWMQRPNLRCLVPRDSIDASMWQQLLAERGIVYSDSDDFNIEHFESSINELLNELGVAVAKQMHLTGMVREIFFQDLPIIVHGLEYDDSTAERTAAANPSGLSDNFCSWIRSQ